MNILKLKRIIILLTIISLCLIMSPTAMGEANITITLHSTYPADALLTNYSGIVSVHYIVNSSNNINRSSLAFLYGINYTINEGDMHSYIKVPENSIAFDGIYRAPYRNKTPYLSWEFNDTITNNSVWQWGGYDNDSAYISYNSINSTHTWVNVTGRTQEILSSSFYIARQSMYESPKTGFEIDMTQSIIIKIWDVEKIRGRNSNYLIGLVFDTDIKTTPDDDILIRYCNASFDPDNDDPRTSLYCQDVITADYTRWMNHTWIPHANSSYSKPLIVDASDFYPTDTGYLYLSSGTILARSYILNATNYDPSICNRTFAQTNSMWTFHEATGVSTSVTYTPSFFALFARNYMEMEFQMYIADNQSEWAHSGIDTKEIGLSQYPVDPVTFEFFNISCPIEGYIHDSMMDATYDNGYINIGLYCPGDPDGGNVSQNVTIHYLNQTLAGIVNNTLITNGSEHVEISFNTTPYYSTIDMYILKCVSTDDEGSIVTKWLDSEFTLAPDGTQGWVKDDMLLFWGMNNIPTLYSEVNNSSYISYDGGNDIYTMHVPFFKSKCNETFYFNETVHLKSLNNENVTFFRFSGCTIFDNATILGWNTTSNTIAPDSDTYRGYLFSCCNVCGNITNSNISYLGNSTLYQQEGLNFIGNSLDFLIYNTILSHNGEGVVMEYCSNFNISQCTISDNKNVGIGIYHSNDTIVANNTIDSNGGRGVTMYEGNNNIIRYNDITNSGVHGVHFWSNSQNNTCIRNNITGSGIHDYYLTSSSTDNYIIDPVSSTNQIRCTSTSSLNIENTDNTIFTEDSLNTSYAYPTNYSMFVSGVSQTFNITQRDMTVTPSTDKVSIWNLEWGSSIKFNVSSDTASNPTWFNMTNISWAKHNVLIYRNGTLFANETTDTSGVVSYNYSDSYSEKWFEFVPVNSNNFIFTNSIISPISIFESEPFTVSVDINDSDGTIVNAVVKINDNNYSMTSAGGDTWSYYFTGTSTQMYEIDYFYAQDDFGEWDSTSSDLYINVLTKVTQSSYSGAPSAVGAGTSNEPLRNVECKESGILRNIKAGVEITYTVKDTNCLKVTNLSFIPTANSRDQPVYLETLKSRSVFVTEDVPGYKIHYFNLFVGLLGYDSKTEQENINFKLKISGIEEANLEPESMKLYKWSDEDETWIRKYTELTGVDEEFYYYESDSGATTGYFAISGREAIPEVIQIDKDLFGFLPGLGNFELIIPGAIGDTIITPFFDSIGVFINNVIAEFVPSAVPEEDIEFIGFTITSQQDTTETSNGAFGLMTICLFTLILTGVLSLYYNSDKWFISMFIAILLLGSVYTLFGNEMIVLFSIPLLNIVFNIIIIASISYLVPDMFNEIKGNNRPQRMGR